MLSKEMQRKADALWLEFHTGGITNPITVIEQISYLLFIRLLDMDETRNEARERRARNYTFEHTFKENQQHLRWSNFKQLGSEQMLDTVRDEVFPFLKSTVFDDHAVGQYLKSGNCLIEKASLLTKAVEAISSWPLNEGDTKGDLYEHFLGKLGTAGINGQFRTPRHIIALMVALMDPQPDEVVGDPACGTAGFLVSAMQYLKRMNSTEAGTHEVTHEDGSIETVYDGDKLTPYKQHIENDMFWGFEFDSSMLRIAAMNMLLHGVDSPNVHYQDTLGSSFTEKRPRASKDFFNVILANPPFKGSLDASDVHESLRSVVKTKKTELLFLALMLRMLKPGGRCAVIVPDGVLFGSSKAHKEIRKRIIENHQLEAVISLPSGVFKPYAGVSTAILIFTKDGETEDVWFYDMQADGYSLDDKRDPQLEASKLGPLPEQKLAKEEQSRNNLPDVLARWKKRSKAELKRERTEQSFCVPKCDIAAEGYDLSLNRYKEIKHVEIEYDSPRIILKRLKKLESEITTGMRELDGMIS